MKTARKRLGALMLAAAMPGFCAFSCSGTLAREFRDAAISGATSVVEQAVIDALSSVLPDQDDE